MNEDEKKRPMQWCENENQKMALSEELYDLRNETTKILLQQLLCIINAICQFNKSMMNELVRSNVKDIIVSHQCTILADFITLPQLVIHWYVGMAMPQRTLAIVPHK